MAYYRRYRRSRYSRYPRWRRYRNYRRYFTRGGVISGYYTSAYLSHLAALNSDYSFDGTTDQFSKYIAEKITVMNSLLKSLAKRCKKRGEYAPTLDSIILWNQVNMTEPPTKMAYSELNALTKEQWRQYFKVMRQIRNVMYEVPNNYDEVKKQIQEVVTILHQNNANIADAIEEVFYLVMLNKQQQKANTLYLFLDKEDWNKEQLCANVKWIVSACIDYYTSVNAST